MVQAEKGPGDGSRAAKHQEMAGFASEGLRLRSELQRAVDEERWGSCYTHDTRSLKVPTCRAEPKRAIQGLRPLNGLIMAWFNQLRCHVSADVYGYACGPALTSCAQVLFIQYGQKRTKACLEPQVLVHY